MIPENIIGKSISRVESAEKATGTAVFTADMKLPNMLFGKVLRSPYPHAKIVSIDTSKAEALPGVKAVVTYKNSPSVIFNTAARTAQQKINQVDDEVIFGKVVRYVGDEIAAVAATSEEIAAEALTLIEVNYEILPAVFDPLEAMKPDAPQLHDCKNGNNIATLIKLPMGDVEQGFAESETVIEQSFKVPVQKHCQLENHAAIAEVSHNGRITVWSPTQTPHTAKNLLAKIFGLPASKVRVLNPPYIGGGFGARIGFCGKTEPIAVLLAQKTGRPVLLSYDRKEDFIASDTRHSGYITVKLGAKKDGQLKALYINAVLNTGAYASYGPDVIAVLGTTNCSVYRVPNVLFEGSLVYTNTTTAAAMRGFGNPQGNYALECSMDILAEKLGLDPVELRLKNIIKPFDKWMLPYPCATSALEDCIQLGAKSIGWERRNEPKVPVNHKVRGIGMACGTHVSNAGPWAIQYDNAYLAVQQDGSVLVTVGITDMGQGSATALTQVAAEALGVPVEKVHVLAGDTDTSPHSLGSNASRTLYSAGLSIINAADKVKQQILDFCAGEFGVDSSELSIKNGIVSCKDPNKGQLKFEEVCDLANHKDLQFVAVGRNKLSNAPPWIAHFAEVEVDLETGEVEVLRFVAAHDSGKIINPTIVEGQIEGAVLQGVGYALSEQIVYNDKGQQAQDSFHEYYMPSIKDTPEIETIIVETEEPSGPFGAKGVGECAQVPVAGAIANAVANAIGDRINELPMNKERVLAAIMQKEK
ncbi:MAG TPA: molybdopterin-dependent oxidoreductase [Firmicutes bacterium]|jgi:xanthine dehydrogenase molybdenum-binding subunit|nr:molybdopterin-dependent oxidoreductase [Bacillota bacterium]